MKRTILFVSILAAMISLVVCADPATPDPLQTQVQTHLRIDVDKETDTIHWISTNDDPDIVTKTYVLKHADPYEIRPYIRRAANSNRIDNSTSGVECVKYNDGTGVIIVSAEDYKFDKEMQNGGQTIDEIIAMLDQPKITSSSGKGKFLYFPKARSATDLVALLSNVGMTIAGSNPQELLRGKDEAFTDDELNAIWFYISNWSIKHIMEMLKVYDRPPPEVKVRYKIYEISSEGDDKIGVDFQAWKNGPGSDIFTAAGRYAHGWDFANNIIAPSNINNSRTKFIKFSPKWNSRYLDLLAARGKAAVLTSGTVSIQNVQEGRVQALTQYPAFAAGAANTANTLMDFVRYNDIAIRNNANGFAIMEIDIDGDLDYDIRFSMNDTHGNPILFGNDAAQLGVDLLITRTTVQEDTTAGATRNYYTMEFPDVAGGSTFRSNGSNRGTKIRGYDLTMTQGAITWDTSQNYNIPKDNDRNTNVNNLQTAGDAYGFSLRLIPSIAEGATTLDINMYNTSLIGFQNNGNPRTERSELNTKVMVNNAGSRFIVGGINKKEIVNSVSKLPYLGDIPILGWVFSSESAVTKKSQIVAVLDCVPVLPTTQIDTEIIRNIEDLTNKVKDAGSGHPIGFDQFLIDSEKKGLDPLP